MTKNVAGPKSTTLKTARAEPTETEQGIPDSTLELIARLDPTFFPATSAARRALAQDRPVSLGRHKRKCSVCRHPERHDIEQDFLHWRNPDEIAAQYGLSGWSAVYRHVRAFGLFAERRRNARFALEYIIERVNEIDEVTPRAVVAAVNAFTRINNQGEWVEPPRQVTVSYVRAQDSLAAPAVEAKPAAQPASSSHRAEEGLAPTSANEAETTAENGEAFKENSE
jgi:hypothetical protein